MKKITKSQNYTTTIVLALVLIFTSTACQNLPKNTIEDDKAVQYSTLLALVQEKPKNETLPSLEVDLDDKSLEVKRAEYGIKIWTKIYSAWIEAAKKGKKGITINGKFLKVPKKIIDLVGKRVHIKDKNIVVPAWIIGK